MNSLGDNMIICKTGWYDTIKKFVELDEEIILENLKQNEFEQFSKNSSLQQISAWKNSIKILQNSLKNLISLNPNSSKWTIIFEFMLPREGGRRPDVIILSKKHVLILEFKDFDTIKKSHIDQVSAYSKDIRTYHHKSHDMFVIPILITTRWDGNSYKSDDVYVVNKDEIDSFVSELFSNDEDYLNVQEWINSDYFPLPSIIQAARMIFQHKALPKIKSAQSAGIPGTINILLEIAKNASKTNSKNLVLVTGVPGAGKTLVGLQLVHTLDTLDTLDKHIDGVFLSGNRPLVEVLQYALESKKFVQHVHNFLKEYGGNSTSTPHENIWIYDEAQRAWDSERVLEKRGHGNSEPDDFIKLADKLDSWSLIVGLIGEGQQIHLGEESGLKLWKDAIIKSKNNWKIFCPEKLENIFSDLDVTFQNELDLTKTLRSHIAEDVTLWVSKLIDGQISEANELTPQIKKHGFELYITRDLECAKLYVKERYDNQNEKRFGLLASSNAKILPNYGVFNDWQSTRFLKIGPWYNDEPTSTQSCCALNSVATEFSCQGLELDMPIVCWGEDLIWNDGWKTTTKRSKAKNPHLLRLNSYRVLLTRGRDGIMIYIPNEIKLDSTYKILVKSGLVEL